MTPYPCSIACTRINAYTYINVYAAHKLTRYPCVTVYMRIYAYIYVYIRIYIYILH